MELELTVSSKSKAKSARINVSEGVFAKEYNEALIHQVVTAYLTNGRAGTKANKNRSEVSGGGKKPWRQKGTGRARAGSSRSPLWRSGGVTFAAKPRDYTQKINTKMYQHAMCSILSELLRQKRLIVVENFELKAPKTKLLLEELKSYELADVLIVTDEQSDSSLSLAARNLHKVAVENVVSVNPVSLLAYKSVLLTAAALKKLEEKFV